MKTGLVKLGGCYSGLKWKTPQPKIFGRMAIGTPLACEAIEKDRDLQTELSVKGFNQGQSKGLRFKIDHGRDDLTYFSARLVGSADDEKLFQTSYQLFWSPDSVEGRDLLFRMIGIKIAGLSELTTEECMQLGGVLRKYRKERGTYLFDISSISIDKVVEALDTSKDQQTSDGLSVVISKGDLSRIQRPDQRWIRRVSLSNLEQDLDA